MMKRDILHTRRVLERVERVGDGGEGYDLGSHLVVVVVVVGAGHAMGEWARRVGDYVKQKK